MGLYMYISPFVLNRRQPFHSVIGPADLPCFKELLYSYVSQSINVSAAILYRIIRYVLILMVNDVFGSTICVCTGSRYLVDWYQAGNQSS